MAVLAILWQYPAARTRTHLERLAPGECLTRQLLIAFFQSQLSAAIPVICQPLRVIILGLMQVRVVTEFERSSGQKLRDQITICN